MKQGIGNQWFGSASRHLALLCGLASMVFWSQLAQAKDCPRELPVNTSVRSSPLSDNKLFAVNSGGETRQVLLHWDDLPASDASAGETPVLVDRFIAHLKAYLQTIGDQSFRIPPGAEHPCVTGKLLRIYFYQAPDGKPAGAFASNSRLDVTFSQSSADRGTIIEDTMPILSREMFDLVQAQYHIGAMGRQWLTDATASLATDTFLAALEKRTPQQDESCRRPVQSNLDSAIPSDGRRFGDEVNACQAVAFWGHLTEQLATDRSDPVARMRIVHELYEFLESYRELPAWKTAATDRIHGAGDFDGDGQEELLLTSATHLGLLASTEAQSRVLVARAFGARVEGNWTLRASDQILGVGDFNGNGKDEFLIRNGGFTALIGVERGGRLRVVSRMALGTAVFADWRPAFRDQLIAIGDFDGDGADEAMFRGRSRVGVVRFNRWGQFVSPMSTSLSRLVRHLNRNPAAINIVGTGDIDGNGSDEIVARDARGVFVWGLDAQDRHQLMHEIDFGERIGEGWLLSPDDNFMGVHDLDGTVNDQDDNPGLRAEIVLTGSSGLAIIGMNAFSRELETKAALSFDVEPDKGFDYGPGTRLMAVGRLLGSAGHQIVLRDGHELSLLEYTYRSPNSGLLRLATSLSMAPGTLAAMPQLRRQRLERGRLTGRFNVVDRWFIREITGAMTAALSGREASHLITRGANRLLYFNAGAAPDAQGLLSERLLLVNQDVDGQFQKSLVDVIDAFIGLKDPNQTFASLWRESGLAPHSD